MTLQSDGPDHEPIDESVRVRREAERAAYDRETINRIVDAALVAHVGTVRDGQPVVVPMFCVRDGDWLLLHGAPAAGLVRRATGRSGGEVEVPGARTAATEVCVTMTLLDGLVLARSAFHHSMNYRSVVVLGRAEEITDQGQKERALEIFVERLIPGRQSDLRPTTAKEIQATSVLRLPLDRASAKVRTGPPIDDDHDYDLGDIWAGVLPVTTSIGPAVDDPHRQANPPVPDNVQSMVGRSL